MEEIITDLYKGNVQIRFTPGNHAYWLLRDTDPVKPMKRLTGVTSFTGKVFDKSDNLIAWALDLTSDYLESHREELLEKKADLTAIFEHAKMESHRQKERAATIGKAVHAWIESHTTGQKPDMPDDPAVLKGVLSFVEWAEENKVEFVWSERMVYSKRYKYVGTADACFLMKAGPYKGKRLLGDYKVSNGLYSSVRLQTAAYQGAVQEEDKKEKFDGRIAIRISAESEQEYMERMEKKWIRREYKSPIPPYQNFECRFFPAETFHEDYEQAMNAWSLIRWDRNCDTYIKSY